MSIHRSWDYMSFLTEIENTENEFKFVIIYFQMVLTIDLPRRIPVSNMCADSFSSPVLFSFHFSFHISLLWKMFLMQVISCCYIHGTLIMSVLRCCRHRLIPFNRGLNSFGDQDIYQQKMATISDVITILISVS